MSPAQPRWLGTQTATFYEVGRQVLRWRLCRQDCTLSRRLLRVTLNPHHDGAPAMIRLLMNVLWFVLGGVWMGLAWWLYGLLCFVSIVGIPWGRSCFLLGSFAFFPFGKTAISRKQLTGKDDIGTGVLGTLGNLIWFVVAGVWLAIGHLGSALACAITIIGIPFAIQHVKLALIALWPIGQTVVSNERAGAVHS